MTEEVLDIVDRMGRVIGQAPRRQCHGNPVLIHQSVHVLVFDRQGRLFLQKRSERKDIAPGLWDTSVGGHLQPGETPEQGAHRELDEELGVSGVKLERAYQYLWESSVETELVRAFVTLHEGPFRLQPDEISEGRFWDQQEIEGRLASGDFTPQFAAEFPRMQAWWRRKQISMTHFTR